MTQSWSPLLAKPGCCNARSRHCECRLQVRRRPLRARCPRRWWAEPWSLCVAACVVSLYLKYVRSWSYTHTPHTPMVVRYESLSAEILQGLSTCCSRLQSHTGSITIDSPSKRG